MAMDRRKSLRQMIARAAGVELEEIRDARLAEFKGAVTGALTPCASAVLLDPDYGLTAARERAATCGLLLACEMDGYENPRPRRMLARDFPQHPRGVANALLDAGSKPGPALGTLPGGLLMAKTGWRGLFIGLGAGSLLRLIPWFIWMPRSRGAGPPAEERSASPAALDILRQREAWGAFAGHFCGNYYWFFLLTWLPGYLVKERGYSIEGMAQAGSAAYFAIAAATVVAGWISDRWIARGATATRARKTIVGGGLLFSTVILPVAATDDRALSLGLLFAACIGFGTYTSNHWAITQTLAGPQAAGRWTSIQNGIGNLSGIVAAWLTGVVVEKTGAFHTAFAVSAAVALPGAVMWGAVVREVKTVAWEARS